MASTPPTPAASPRANSDKPTRFKCFFGVHDVPASSLFTAFKRQFLASVGYGRGFIEIQSKTKAKELVRLSISDLKGKPFIKHQQPNVVCLLNNNRVKNSDWSIIEIRTDNSRMAEDFQETLVKNAWPVPVLPAGRPNTGPIASFNIPRTPLTPAAATQQTGTVSSPRPASTAAATAQKTCNVTTPTSGDNGFKAPLPSPLVASTPRGEDTDCRLVDGTTMRIRINPGNPAESSVVQPPLYVHRPTTVKREPPDSSTNVTNVVTPSQQMDSESERMLRTFGLPLSNSVPRAQSAARVLQFEDASGVQQSASQVQSTPRTGYLMQRMLQEQQQPQICIGQLNTGGPRSPDVNVNTEASFMLQTPAQSPLSPHDVQQTLLLQQLLTGMQASPMGQPSFEGGLGGLNSPQPAMGLNGSFGGLNGCGGGALMGNDDVTEYRAYAAEIEKIAAEFWKMSDEKAFLARDTAQAMATLLSTLSF